MTTKNLGINLRNARTAAGLTQPQLAERAGIEQGYLSKLENERATPSQEVLERLAAALAVTPEQLSAPSERMERSAMNYALGALLGIATVAVGLLVASPDELPLPTVPHDAPFTLTVALDAAPPGVEVHALHGGEPGRMLSIRGRAKDERAVRAYLEVLEPFGRVELVELRPLPWWRFGGVDFDVAVQVFDRPAGGDAGAIAIGTHSGSERELAAKAQLERILREHDLSRWLFTDEVRIQSGVIPHSHPVLTVGPQYLDDDRRQLATFVHEQIHWFAERHFERVALAIAELERRYPDAPTGGPEGARDRDSSYLHLVVCWLEFDALARLLGEAAARDVLADKHYYRWIYRTVLADSQAIGDLLREHDLLIE